MRSQPWYISPSPNSVPIAANSWGVAAGSRPAKIRVGPVLGTGPVPAASSGDTVPNSCLLLRHNSVMLPRNPCPGNRREILPAASTVSQTGVADGSIRLGSWSRQSAGEKEAGISREGWVPRRIVARRPIRRRAETGLTRRRRQPAGRQRVKAWPAGQRRQSVAIPPPARCAERRRWPRGASFRTYCLPLERRKHPLSGETSLETHRRGGACGKLARKRRSRRTADPETAPSWTPSLQFAPL